MTLRDASGTGKTHLAQAIGQAVIYAGLRVRFTSAVVLAQELLAAQNEHRLPRYLKGWQRIDLVVFEGESYRFRESQSRDESSEECVIRGGRLCDDRGGQLFG